MILLWPAWLWLLLFGGIYLLYRRQQGGGVAFSGRSLALAAAFVLAVAALTRPVLPRER